MCHCGEVKTRSRSDAARHRNPPGVPQERHTLISIYHLPEDIRNEFYVKADGTVCAKSWAAVARLAGVRYNSILDKLLPRIFRSTPEMLPATLKPLAGMDLRHVTEIDEKIISCIVNYYAWESRQATNDTAKQVALVFNSIGVRAFFQTELGWKDPKNDEIAELKSLMMLMYQDVQHMKSDLAVFKDAGNQYPGITNIVHNTTKILMLPSSFKEPFSIRDWVFETHGRNLTGGECKSIGRMVAGTMTTLKLESPLKYGTAKVYRYSDMAALQTIWKSWLVASGTNN